ncbi:MAG: ABC transporter substrate-binding protein [Lachnospiraceae bacterium]|nr:ABC transporter substrate-binding protein [Lachnospiraceae bacterium]
MLLVLGLFVLSGCKQEMSEADRDISPQLVYESRMDLVYAKEFTVDYYEGGYALITIADSDRYLVVPEGCAVPDELEEGIVVLEQPLDHMYLVASAVMDMFSALDGMDAIRFSGQDADGWYIEKAREAMESGEILYAGKYNMPDYELILSEGCSLAIENTMISHSPEVKEKLEEFGIPVMVDYSSYENHPLGRVEWVKLYGVLLQKPEQAEEIFQTQADILERIDEAEESGATVAFFYITANGSVNVRKSSDYVPRMIGLAGGTYVFDDLGDETDHKSSVNMQMEQFYKEAFNADYLIYNSTIEGELTSVEELLQKSEMLKDFKAVQEGNVYCTTSDLYQQTMSLGVFIEDIYKMLSGSKELQADMQYLYHVE